jgi:hypothetical protein
MYLLFYLTIVASRIFGPTQGVGVAVGRGFEPQSDLELSFAEILIA